jgi:hypothetical protein
MMTEGIVVPLPSVSETIVKVARGLSVKFNEEALRQYAAYKTGRVSRNQSTVKMDTLKWWVRCYDFHFNKQQESHRLEEVA